MRAAATGHTFESALAEASTLLSGVSRGAGVVVTTKQNPRLKHVEFVRLEPTRALVVLVSEDGSIENRLVDLPPGLPPSGADRGRKLPQRPHPRPHARRDQERDRGRAGPRWSASSTRSRRGSSRPASRRAPGRPRARHLIVRGQANLLEDLRAVEDLERIRLLFADLETQTDVIELLTRAEGGEGVRIFIGSENKLFSMSGSSMIAAPFRDASQKIVGVIGVIGPTRLNYARIVPMVDYTAKVVSRILEGGR